MTKHLETDKNLNTLAKDLRKNMTPEEKHLWYDFFEKLSRSVHPPKGNR